MSLLMPAFQEARESARRMACSNNLRQIGIANHNHVSVHNFFPYTSSSPGFANRRTGENEQLSSSPHVHLLAFIDAKIYEKIDFSDPWLSDISRPFVAVNDANNQLLKTNIPLFRCPSDRFATGANNYRANVGTGLMMFFHSKREERDGRGAFVHARPLPMADFSDGLSHTALFSEKVIGDYDETTFSPFRDRVMWLHSSPSTVDELTEFCSQNSPVPLTHHSYSGWNWMMGGLNATWYNHIRTPNSRMPDCSRGTGSVGGGSGIYSARSFHKEGVNVLLADGAVRFVSSSVAINVWQAIGTRNGGETFSN
jgi:hypothetical protein